MSLGHRTCLLTAEYALFEFCIFRRYGAILTIVENFFGPEMSQNIKIWSHLSRGVLPENLRRGPYAVVDERCDETTLFHKEWLLFVP